MQKIINILEHAQFEYIATLEHGYRRVRPIQYQGLIENRLWFATGSQKALLQQLKENPVAEF